MRQAHRPRPGPRTFREFRAWALRRRAVAEVTAWGKPWPKARHGQLAARWEGRSCGEFWVRCWAEKNRGAAGGILYEQNHTSRRSHRRAIFCFGDRELRPKRARSRVGGSG